MPRFGNNSVLEMNTFTPGNKVRIKKMIKGKCKILILNASLTSFLLLFAMMLYPPIASSDITIGDTVFNDSDIENYNVTIEFINSLSNENNAAFFEGMNAQVELKREIILMIISMGISIEDLANNQALFDQEAPYSAEDFAIKAVEFAELIKSGEDDRRMVSLFIDMDLVTDACVSLLPASAKLFAKVISIYAKIVVNDIRHFLDTIYDSNTVYTLVALFDLEECGHIVGTEPVEHEFFPLSWGNETPKFFTADVKGQKDESASVRISYNIFKNHGYRPSSLDSAVQSLPEELSYYETAQYIVLILADNLAEFDKEVSIRTLWNNHWNVEGVNFLIDTGLGFPISKGIINPILPSATFPAFVSLPVLLNAGQIDIKIDLFAEFGLDPLDKIQFYDTCSLPALSVDNENVSLWYKDADFDGFTDGEILQESVRPSLDYVTADELYSMQHDCDDQDPNVNPHQNEVCGDGIDNNCDFNIDEICNSDDLVNWYKDSDQDGASDGTIVRAVERPSDSYVLASNLDYLNGDCDDNDPDVNSSQDEICGDKIDNNCDSNIDESCNFLINSHVNLSETGQLSCYDENGNSIDCEGTGQDADLSVGISLPSPRYQDNEDGTFSDRLTGLTWIQNGNCSASTGYDPDNTQNGSMTWQSALEFVYNINNGSCSDCAAGYSDWRLPNINELKSLYYFEGYVTDNLEVLQNKKGSYWSSTTVDAQRSSAWGSWLGSNNSFDTQLAKSDFSYVLLVRGASNGMSEVWQTGQKSCYDSSGNSITCLGTGQDGDIQAGKAWPFPRFIIDDRTITDRLTGLSWLKDANCIDRCYPQLGNIGICGNGFTTWQGALDFVNGMNNGTYSCCNQGYNDWRLPNARELSSLVDYQQSYPSMNPYIAEGLGFISLFNNTCVTGTEVWASTTVASWQTGSPDAALVQEFFQGTTRDVLKLQSEAFVWPVRGGNYLGKPSVVVPDRVYFDCVSINETIVESITVENTGSDILDIPNISIEYADAAEFTIVKDDCSGRILYPAGSCSLDVEFEPASDLSKRAYLKIYSNDPHYSNGTSTLLLGNSTYNCTDTDGDGIIDTVEIGVGLAPNDVDTDDDGMADGWEYQHNSVMDPGVADGYDDFDNDGYSNLREYLAGTNPGDDRSTPDQPIHIYVNANHQSLNDGMGENGTQEHPFSGIKNALGMAAMNDELWVTAGTYIPGSQPENSFELKSGVALYGGFIGTETSRSERDWVTNVTVLSGDINGDDEGTINNSDNAHHVVKAANNTVLDGFTIQGGNTTEDGGGIVLTGSAVVKNCIFEQNTARSGGAIWDDGNSLIDNCQFKGNEAEQGGAISSANSDSITTVSLITNCSFQDNVAQSGAALYNLDSSPEIENCAFLGNSAQMEGGAIHNNNASPHVVNSSFFMNLAGKGGGIYNCHSSSPEVLNSRFYTNSATIHGGAICNYSESVPYIKNCVFAENTATLEGGGIRNDWQSASMITNCTFVKNSADNEGGGISNWSDSSSIITITNSIFWENTAASGSQIENFGSTIIVNYSCVQDDASGDGIVFTGAGNIDDDPIFVDTLVLDGLSGTADDNFHLGYESPCINTGTIEGTSYNDMGAFPAVTVGTTGDFSSIEDALDNIKSYEQGGSILLSSGEYLTDRLVVDGPPVSIIGQDKDTTSLQSAEYGQIDVNNSRVHLENLSLRYGTWIDNSHAVIQNCIIDTGSVGVFFLGNKSTSSGAVQNCILTNNDDAIRIYRSSNPIFIINNTISYNTAPNGGDGIYIMNTTTDNPVPPVISNNIISHNSRYGIFEDYLEVSSLDAEVTNNCFFGNGSSDYRDHTQAVYTGADQINQNVENGESTVDGNISQDPLFVGGIPFDYHIIGTSPAVNAGNPTPSGIYPIVDMDGEVRPEGAVFDIGADEFFDSDGDSMADYWENQWFGDLSHDGTVDSDTDGLTDLEESQYGTKPLLPDSDGDGVSDGEEVSAGTDPNNDKDLPNSLITVDGNSFEWSSFYPVYVDPEGDSVCNSDTDLKAVYTAMDDQYVYLMVETYGKPVKNDAVFEMRFDYQRDDTNYPGQIIDLGTNIGDGYFNAWIDPDGDGEIEPYPIDVQAVAVGEVLEVAIPRAELGYPDYFNVVFAALWDYDFTDPVCDIGDIDLNIYGSVMNVREPDGSLNTYLEVELGDGYDAGLPGIVDSVVVTGPYGEVICTMPYMEYSPEFKSYFYRRAGPPEIGTYTFTIQIGTEQLVTTDSQDVIRELPFPNTNTFSPADGALLDTKTPTFSIDPVQGAEVPVFYRLEIADLDGNRVFASARVADLGYVTLPDGILQEGQTYKWRVRVTDASQWIPVQNRSQSDWLTFTMAPTLNHAAIPAVDLDGWGVVRWNTSEGTGLDVWVKVFDHDGIAYDGSSHHVTLERPDSQIFDLQYQYADSGAVAYYSTYIDYGAGTPATGDYVFTVADPDGNTGTVTDTLEGAILDPPDGMSITPTLQNPVAESISASFDNIAVNGAAYDDFSTYGTIDDLDPSKWSSRGCDTADIVDQKLVLAKAGLLGSGGCQLAFANPETINRIQADITVDAASSDIPKARITGYFFSEDGIDNWVQVAVFQDRVAYNVHQEVPLDGYISWRLITEGVLMSVSVGQTVSVGIDWDGSVMTFSADGNSATYTPTGVVAPPQNAYKELSAKINLQMDSTTPTFTWDPVPGANRYRIRIYTDDGSSTVWRGYTSETSYTVPPGVLMPDADYRFRLEARDSHDPIEVDNASKFPASNGDNIRFTTGPESPDPYIDLDNTGVETWSGSSFGPTLSFWVKVYDPQGVPGDIESVAAILPGGTEVPLRYNYNQSGTCAVYTADYFEPLTTGSYTLRVEDREHNFYEVGEDLDSDPIDGPDESSLTPIRSTVLGSTAVDFDWSDVSGKAFYRVEIYDANFNRIYTFATTESHYELPEGYLEEGKYYAYRITTRREFFDENVDNGSSSPWSSDNRFNFITTAAAGGSLPQITTDSWGAVLWHNPRPDDPATSNYWMAFSVRVTDADGPPHSIQKVEVTAPSGTTFPDGSTTRVLSFDSMGGSDDEAYYWYMEDISDPASMPEGTYTFTVTDVNDNTATTTDDFSRNVLPQPTNLLPLPDSDVAGTTPTISWDPVAGAAVYRVEIYSESGARIHRPYVEGTSYTVPSDVLELEKSYSYRVRAHREDPRSEDMDNMSSSMWWDSLRPYFTTAAILDTDGDGIPDTVEDASDCLSSSDADTDDDGIADGVEDADHDGVVDAGETSPCLADTDGDGIQDGTESGVTVGTADTNSAVFVPDLDPTTTTDPLLADSDGDGILDGLEDSNQNGRVDAGESDPNTPDAANKAMPWIPLLLLGD